MKKILLLSLLLGLPLIHAPSAHACAPTHECMGPTCWFSLLKNGDFSGTTCAQDWDLIGATIQSTWECSMTLSPRQDDYALFATMGGYGGSDRIEQSFSVPGQNNEWASLELSIGLSTTALGSWWDQMRLLVYDNSTGQTVHSFQVRTDLRTYLCDRLDFDISGPFKGRSLRLEIEGRLFTEMEYHLISAHVFLTN